MELWTAALGYFPRPVPEYQPGDDSYLLKPVADRQPTPPLDH